MKQIRIMISMLLVSVMGTAFAQVVSPVDFMCYNSRAAFSNPATYCNDYGYFDFVLGGINVGFQNVGLKYDRFFQFNSEGQPVTLTLNEGVDRLRDNNYLNTYVDFDVFNCGRRTKYGFFTYTHRLRERETLRYSKDMVRLLANGNGNFVNDNSANIDFALAARAWQEFDFGYQMSLTEKLNLGVRLKFLMGIADIKTENNLQLFTNADTYALKLMADMNARAALPYKVAVTNGNLTIPDKRFNMANLFKNFGAGIDLGGEYMINEEFGVAAAVTDLGFISWKNNAVEMHGQIVDGGPWYQNGGLVFQGLSNEQILAIANDPDTYFDHYLDTLQQYFDWGLNADARYTSGLNTTLMVRGYYNLTPEHRFSAQLMGYATGLGMKPAVTLAYTGSFLEKFDVVGTYTMMPGSFDNIGLGLSANLGAVTLYVASNNILGFFNPTNLTQTNLQFGISFSSSDKVSRSETIILRDY